MQIRLKKGKEKSVFVLQVFKTKSQKKNNIFSDTFGKICLNYYQRLKIL